MSALITDFVAVCYNEPLGESTGTIDAFNRWLLDRFGTKPTYLVLFNKKIVTNQRGLAALRKATEERR